MTDKQPKPTEKSGWGLYNWGHLRAVERTRRECIRLAQESYGEPWRKCKRYYTVCKVRVIPDGGRSL